MKTWRIPYENAWRTGVRNLPIKNILNVDPKMDMDRVDLPVAGYPNSSVCDKRILGTIHD